jgi:integrase
MAPRKNPIRLKTAIVDDLPFALSTAHPVFYWDDRLKGFGVKVSTQGKRYIAETKVEGKTVRVTCGSHPADTAEDARRKASELLGQMKARINPNAEQRAKRNLGRSFKEICEDYLLNKELKPLTVRDYKKHQKNTLGPWSDKPFTKITREMVVDLYRDATSRTITRQDAECPVSAAQANQAFRFARAVFTFAKRFRGTDDRPLLSENPVDVLSENRLWRRVNKRQRVIKKHQLRAFWEAAWKLKNDSRSQDRETIRDFLLLLLFTGLRLGEARDLMWKDIDLDEGTLTISDPKNHMTHVLPLSDYLIAFFRYRKEQTAQSEWVFPATKKMGMAPVIEFRKTIRSICEASGVEFTPHDLRRSFLTFTKDLPAKYGPFFSKRLANHKISDITADYIQIGLEDLRMCMQDITDLILKHSGALSSRIGMFSPPTPEPAPVRRIRIRKPETVVIRIPV